MHALLIALALATAPAPVAPNVTAHFQIVFTRTSDGYSAECSSGCLWTALRFACGADYSAVIDEAGVRVVPNATHGEGAFASQFHLTAEGFELTSFSGTAWLNLAWTCGLLPCAAHVNEFGVSGSAVGE